MDETAGDTGNEESIVNLELNGVLELLVTLDEHLVEALGLGNCARKTVEDETNGLESALAMKNPEKHIPILALRVVGQLALDHVDHDLVADKTTLVHDLLGLPSELSLLRDLGPQHVTGGLK